MIVESQRSLHFLFLSLQPSCLLSFSLPLFLSLSLSLSSSLSLRACAAWLGMHAQVSPDKAPTPAWNVRVPEPMTDDADVAKVPATTKAVKVKRGSKSKAEEGAAMPLADISQAVPKTGKRSAK